MGDMESPDTRKGSAHSPAGNLAGLTFGMASMHVNSSNSNHAAAPGGFNFTNAAVTMPNWGPSSHAVSPTFSGQDFCQQQMSPMAQAFEPGAPYLPSYAPTCMMPTSDVPAMELSSYTGKGKAKAKEIVAPDDMALFTTDKTYHVRRYVNVRNCHKDDVETQLKEWGPRLLHHAVYDKTSSKDMVSLYVCFDDIRDAMSAYEDLTPQSEDASKVQYISDTFFSERAGLAAHVTSKYDAQVLFVAVNSGRYDARAEHIKGRVDELAHSFGDVLAFAQFDQRSFSHAVEFRVEYAKVSDAREAVSQLTQQTAHIWGSYSITAKPFQAVLAELASESPSAASSAPSANSEGERVTHTSPTGRTQWSYGPDGQVIVEQPLKVVPKMVHGATPRSHNTPQNRAYGSMLFQQTSSGFGTGVRGAARSDPDAWGAINSGEDAMARARFSSDDMTAKPSDGQGISIDRIANGQDVRTTIMVRNMPTWWSSDDMKKAIDATSFGQFDFAYLRMDFAQDHNVGYGFVNFVDAQAIIPFVQKYYKKNWVPGLYPPRLGELSYATVQGYDCLVEKFRNSAIMDECPGYRPRLFWSVDNTTDKSLIGTVREFPGPNNMSKKQRSQDNAGQLGLYAPRSGHRADRARRSNYDRGTTRQIEEERNYSWVSGPAFSQAPGGYPGLGMGMMGPPTQAVWGHPQMPHMQMGYAYPAQLPGFPPQYMAPFANQMQPGYGYPVNNQASQLRTLSRGQLGGVRRQATIAPPERFDPLPDPVTGIVPRSMQYPHGPPGTHYQAPVQSQLQYGNPYGGDQYGAQYGASQYDAAPNGNGNYATAASFNDGANFGNYLQHNY